MTALAPTLQAFFTERLISQRAASPNTIAGYRHTPAAAAFAAERSGKTTQPARHRRPRRTAGRRVPGPPRAGPGQQPRHPQQPARRRPLAVRLRRAAPPRARRDDRSGSWRSRPSAPSATSSPTSPARKPTRCSPPATSRPGPAGATTPCSPSRSRPDCGSPSSPPSPASDITLDRRRARPHRRQGTEGDAARRSFPPPRPC